MPTNLKSRPRLSLTLNEKDIEELNDIRGALIKADKSAILTYADVVRIGLKILKDNLVFEEAKNNDADDEFLSLYSGNWHRYYSSQSEADFAFMRLLSKYTQDKQRMIRIFQQSALGIRAKAKRIDYLDKLTSHS